jgi:transposase
MDIHRKPYPPDISDKEWSLIAPYLTLQREGAGRWEHSLRDVFSDLRYIVKTSVPWRWMPNVYRLGPQCTSRPSAGWRRVALKR